MTHLSLAFASSSACVAKRSAPKGACGKSVRLASRQHATRSGRFPTTINSRFTSLSVASADSTKVNVSLSEEPVTQEAAESPSAVEPVAPAPPAPAPAKASFQKRVEEAAAALRSGKMAGVTRRRAPPMAPTIQVNEDGSVGFVTPSLAREKKKTGAPASSSGNQSSSSRQQPSTSQNPNSLITKTESETEMAASQRRLFEQMVTLRTRLNERLAASNKFAKYLEFTLQARDKDIKHANERLVAAMLEIESLKSIAQDAIDAAAEDAAAAESGAPAEEGGSASKVSVTNRLDTLQRRLDLMSKALKRDVEKVDAACIKNVPIRWVGMASDIRIMGSFDHWTKGVAMSPEHIEGGSNVFVADMELVPGVYLIKFVVDGIWQTAQEWPTEGDGLDANNLLIVE